MIWTPVPTRAGNDGWIQQKVWTPRAISDTGWQSYRYFDTKPIQFRFSVFKSQTCLNIVVESNLEIISWKGLVSTQILSQQSVIIQKSKRKNQELFRKVNKYFSRIIMKSRQIFFQIIQVQKLIFFFKSYSKKIQKCSKWFCKSTTKYLFQDAAL